MRIYPVKYYISKADLIQWYQIEKRSYRWIMNKIGCNSARTIKKYLIEYGIEIRIGGEAVATQWIDADKRKKETSERTYKHFANHWKESKGKPLSDHVKKSLSVANGGENNGMFGRHETHPSYMGGKKTWEKGRKMTKKHRQYIFDTLGTVCIKCGENNPELITINHKIPWRECRHHEIWNLEILCQKCHFSQPVRLR